MSTQFLSEGADRVGGQLLGYTECPLNGVTSSGRVWRRKVPESALAEPTLRASLSATLAPNSAVIGYVTEEVALISVHLSVEIGPL